MIEQIYDSLVITCSGYDLDNVIKQTGHFS